MRVSIASNGATPEINTRDGKPLMSLMVNRLAEHRPRNLVLAQRILALHRLGRTIIVLSDRIVQLKILRHMLTEPNTGVTEDDIGLFTGTTKEADRDGQLARPIVLSSYQMANEGLDRRELDTCVMATPKGMVTQAIGRVQRPCETKQAPLVVDVVDDVSLFLALRWKRQREYTRNGYAVQVLNALDAEGVVV